MGTFKKHVDVRSDHFPITATELKKWEGQEDWKYQLNFSDPAYTDIFIGYNHYEQNDNLFLIFIETVN